MNESAACGALRRHIRKQREIHLAACRLVLAKGFDGFTMDDLAEAVGVSRRTLFNHMKDKASAVLGIEDEQLHAAIQVFMAGGPSGRLLDDAFALVATLGADLEADDPDLTERHRLREAAIAADPKVRRLSEEQFTAVSEELVAALCTRQGWPQGDLRARTVGTTLLGLVRLAFDEIAAGRASSFHQAFTLVRDAHLAVLALP